MNMNKFQVTVEQVAVGLPDFPAGLCRMIVHTSVEGDEGRFMRFLRMGAQPARLVYSEDLKGHGNGVEFLGFDNFSYSCPSMSDLGVIEVSEVGVYRTFFNDEMEIPRTKQMIVTLKYGVVLECQAENKSRHVSWILVRRASEKVARWFVDLGEV